jgi:hypothetical protein
MWSIAIINIQYTNNCSSSSLHVEYNVVVVLVYNIVVLNFFHTVPAAGPGLVPHLSTAAWVGAGSG